MRAFGFIFLFWLCAGPAFAQEAEAPIPAPLTGQTADWDVCNETSFVLRFASAFIRSDRMQTVGWTTVQPGACVAVETPVSSPRFLYAESLPVHRGGIREWKGSVELCASEEDFISDSTDNCALSNFETRDYFAVKPTERTTAFIEASDYGVNAEVAGVQRILQDAGYNITRVDGLTGRRTLRTIAEAKADLSLDKNATTQSLIDALIPVAQKAREDVGLDICNDSSARIFSAIAMEQDGNWTSRGWWPVEIGQCVKPYDKTLTGTQAHVFALQEAENEDGTAAPDKRLRSETVVPAQFCIAESRFSALGRENCQDKGYAVADFRPVPTELDGQILRVTDADFTIADGDGLRR